MRLAALTFVASFALAAAALPANAAPAVARVDAPIASNVIEVSGGCGPAGHRDYWNNCVANYYGWGYAHSYPHYYYHHWRHW